MDAALPEFVVPPAEPVPTTRSRTMLCMAGLPLWARAIRRLATLAARPSVVALRPRESTSAGMVMVNLPTAGVDYHVPFGGRKGSSYGPREQGRYAAEFYTTVKTAYTQA